MCALYSKGTRCTFRRTSFHKEMHLIPAVSPQKSKALMFWKVNAVMPSDGMRGQGGIWRNFRISEHCWRQERGPLGPQTWMGPVVTEVGQGAGEELSPLTA